MDKFILLIFAVGLYGYESDYATAVNSMCPSSTGYYVLEGEEFTPMGRDECTTCLCGRNAAPMYCNTIPCEPPGNTECPLYGKEEGCCNCRCLVDTRVDNEIESNGIHFLRDNPDITPSYTFNETGER